MRTGIAAFSGGIILLYWIGAILPAPVLISVLLIATVSASAFKGGAYTDRYGRRFSLVLLCLALGMSWACWRAHDRLDSRLPSAFEMQELTVRGYRCSLPAPGNYHSVRFDFCVTQWPGKSSELASVRKLRLAIYGNDATLAIPGKLQLQIRLKKPHGSYNPVGFHYESWLFRHGYDATGSVQSWQPDPDVICSLRCRYHQWREHVADRLHGEFGQLNHYPLVESLLLGERRFLKPADWSLFRTTGTSHLIAISGLHIGLIGTMVGLLVRWLLLLIPPLWLSQPQRRVITVFAGLLGCLAYALLAGLSVPTQRALVMATVGGIVYLRGRLSGYWTAWLVALALVLAIDPFAVLDRGLWLSFVAVACLIVAFSGRLRPPGKLSAVVSAQFAISAGMLPVLAIMRQAPAALGWLANIFAIPWLSIVVMPVLFLGAAGLMLGVPGIGAFATVMDVSLNMMVAGLKQVASLTPPTQAMPVALAVCMGVLLFFLLFSRGRYTRLMLGISVCSLCPGLLGTVGVSPQPSAPDNDATTPELWVWDVGQGLSVLFRDGDKALLYDTGPGASSNYSAVKSVILPNLEMLGVHSLSLLVISHGDADHASGLGSLLTTMPVGDVISGEPDRLDFGPLRGSVVPTALPCDKAPPVTIGTATVTFWQAPLNLRKQSNDVSCIVRIRVARTEIILPGDVSDTIEGQWLAEHDVDETLSRILLASHHGSKTSSGESWVSGLSPEYVVFSAGYHHPYGHPAEAVSARFQEAGSDVFNTATAGAIHFSISKDTVTAHAQRQDAPFWIAPLATVKP